MSLVENGASSGAVSLRQLFAGHGPAVADPGLNIHDLSALIARGGWPAQQGRSLKAASRSARDYLEQVRRVDISRVGDRSRDPMRVGALLRSLGRHCAQGPGAQGPEAALRGSIAGAGSHGRFCGAIV